MSLSFGFTRGADATPLALAGVLSFRLGGDQLGLRHVAAATLEDELLLAVDFLYLDDDGILAGERTTEHVLGQRVLEVLLDRPAKGTGTVFGIRPLLDEELLGLVGHHQRDTLLLEALDDLAQLDV